MDTFIICSILIIAPFVIYYCFFTRTAIVKRKLRNTEGVRIGSFQNGEVAKVVGAIKYIGKPITAPLSGRKCVYYHILVEENEIIDGPSFSSWKTIIEEEIAGNVVIKDGNNYAIVDTSLVKSYLVKDKQYVSNIRKSATVALEKYLSKHNKKSTFFSGFMHVNLRYKEGILEEGELIAVVGKGTWKRRGEIELDIPAEKILVIGADDQNPVYFSDDPETSK